MLQTFTAPYVLGPRLLRDAYLVDPVHQAIGGDIVAALDGGADGVFVCDIAL